MDFGEVNRQKACVGVGADAELVKVANDADLKQERLFFNHCVTQ